ETSLTLANQIGENFVTQIQTQLATPYQSQLDGLQGQMDAISSRIDETQAELTGPNADKAVAQVELNRLQTTLSEYSNNFQLIQQERENILLSAATASDAVVVTAPAQAPAEPVQYRILYTVIAAVLAALAGIGLAFVLDYWAGKVDRHTNTRTAFGLNTIGVVGRLPEGSPELLMVEQDPNPVIAEDFRRLAINIRQLAAGAPHQKLLLTSPNANEGKSFITANLAVAIATAGLSVIVVDADLHFPRIHDLFDLPESSGLSDSIQQGRVNGSLQSTAYPNLKVLTCGKQPCKPAELTHSSTLKNVLDELARLAAVVLIDTPPVLPVADTAVLATHSSAVLLILRENQTANREVKEAIENLRQVNAPLAGIVLNATQPRKSGYAYRKDGRPSPDGWMQRLGLASLGQFARRLGQSVQALRPAAPVSAPAPQNAAVNGKPHSAKTAPASPAAETPPTDPATPAEEPPAGPTPAAPEAAPVKSSSKPRRGRKPWSAKGQVEPAPQPAEDLGSLEEVQ
ncbi:MAG: CpsD/CapB family tyrosine-protein kinase, partial [Chloroflexi bacterium]|nr:CpsD/CapB family tyrosine-protein kinase [Chloroflexota bacterium]